MLWLLCGPELGVCLEVRDEVFARGVAAAFLTLFAYKLGLGGIDRSWIGTWIGIIDVAASFALKTTRPTHAQVLCDSGSTVHAICLDHLSEDCTLRAGPRP